MSEKIIHGSVRYVSPEIQVSASFKKRELVVTTDEQYPQHILINFVQDKTEYLDGLEIGKLVSVSVNIRGREWLDPKTNINRYFNDIQGWKVSKHTDENNNTHAPVAAPAQVLPANQAAANQAAANFDEEEDDLPF